MTEHKRARNFDDKTGHRYGRLTVRSLADAGKGKATKWQCVCDCGAEKVVAGSNLKSGATSSCGCLQREQSKARFQTHGASGTREFQVWAGMWQRCTNPKHKGYQRYHTFAPPDVWREFSEFLREMGPAPSVEHTLERVDNTRPYGPGNCVWATRSRQARNTSRTIWVSTPGGVSSLPDACEKYGLKYANVKARWYRWGDMVRASEGRFDIFEKEY